MPAKVKARVWIRAKGLIVRLLTFTSYEPCYHGGGPRLFLYRLPSDDPRPRGRHLAGEEYGHGDFYAKLPIGYWVEV